MEIFTLGRAFYPGFQCPIVFHSGYSVPAFHEKNGGYRLIFIHQGNGIVEIGGKSNVFMAPSLFCLNELDDIKVKSFQSVEADCLHFLPQMINSRFTLENVRCGDIAFSCTDWMDCFILQPFIQRTNLYSGLVGIGHATLRRLTEMLSLLKNELSLQKDEFWPCRSRSFFLEILFLIQRLYALPGVNDYYPPLDASYEAEKIILYLHTHYPEKITVTELSRLFNTNRTTLADKFFQTTGQPVMTYLIQLRVRLACIILRDTGVPISELIERVGFHDLTHFGRTFKKLVGMAPTDYREKYSWVIRDEHKKVS